MILLLLLLLLLLGVSWLLNNKDIFAPSFVFCSSFLFSALWATVYSKKWSLNLSYKTFLVITFGVFIFIVISYFVHIILYKRSRINVSKIPIRQNIETWKYICFILFEVIVICMVIKSLTSITKVYGAKDLSNAIYLYRYHSLNGTLIKNLPGYLIWLRSCVSASGYWFAYIFSSKLIYEKKIPLLDSIVIILAMINSSLLGGRNGVVNMIISIFVCSYFIYLRSNGFKFKIKFLNIVKIILVFLLILILFQFTGELLGRNSIINSGVSLIDYLAKYCGAPIKNLDIFINSKDLGNISDNNQTFIYLVHLFGHFFGINTDYVLDLPFNKINGFNLGNVYTTFYPFLYDYGYIGVVFLTGFMAAICQIIYEFARRFNKNSLNVFLNVLYAYFFNSLVFSFFSNKFYEQNFSRGFFRILIFWLLFDLFFLRFSFKGRKISIKL